MSVEQFVSLILESVFFVVRACRSRFFSSVDLNCSRWIESVFLAWRCWLWCSSRPDLVQLLCYGLRISFFVRSWCGHQCFGFRLCPLRRIHFLLVSKPPGASDQICFSFLCHFCKIQVSVADSPRTWVHFPLQKFWSECLPRSFSSLRSDRRLWCAISQLRAG
jgi:hypothetical protein